MDAVTDKLQQLVTLVEAARARPMSASCVVNRSELLGRIDDLKALLPWLAADAVIVVERKTRGEQFSWPAGFEPVRDRKYGASTLRYALRA